MTFNEWLTQEYGQNWQGIQMDLIYHGKSEEEINDEHNKITDKFHDYMELHEIEIIPE